MLLRDRNKSILLPYVCCLPSLLFAAFTACTGGGSFEQTQDTRVLMDTFATITVYHRGEEDEGIRSAIEAAFKGMRKIERATNSYSDSSEISAINNSANELFTISPLVSRCINEAQRIAELSDGSLDISIGALMKLWNFTSETPRVPERGAIVENLARVNYKAIEVDVAQLYLAFPDMQLDLGGVAKGLAVDAAIDSLQARGITDAMVDTGSNIRAIASSLTSGKRRIWIRHPRRRSELYARFRMDEGCVATSGDYERFFFEDSVRYHHILDPHTGYPARRCVSVTVKAGSALEADALSTALFVMGPEKGLALAEQLDGMEAVFLYQEGPTLRWRATRAMVDKLEILD